MDKTKYFFYTFVGEKLKGTYKGNGFQMSSDGLFSLKGAEKYIEKNNKANKVIIEYFQEISKEQAAEIYGMMSIINDMESIGDIIHRNILPLISKKQQLSIDFSEEGKAELLTYNEKVCKQISRLKKAFAKANPKKIDKVIAKEEKYLDLESKYRKQHMERLLDERRESIETHEVHMELMDLMKQINVYAANIAKTIPVAGW